MVKKINNHIFIPSHLKHLNSEIETFLSDNPEYKKNIFLMMRFRDNAIFETIQDTISETLRENGLSCLRADQKHYSSNLWDNVCIYMLGCKYGIVIYEDINERDFNPNITLEVGFMLALGKEILFLKEARLPSLPTDMIGKIYRVFDMLNPKLSVKIQIQKWVDEIWGLRIKKKKLSEINKLAKNIVSYGQPTTLGQSAKPPKVKETLETINTSLRLYFKNDPPENENQVIQALKVILSAARLEFIEEHPYIHYAGRSFRPDLSSKTSDIAIEAKLCRSKEQVKRITAEIIADIIPYQTEFSNIIFIIYDLGFISDLMAIKKDIESNDGVNLIIIKQ